MHARIIREKEKNLKTANSCALIISLVVIIFYIGYAIMYRGREDYSFIMTFGTPPFILALITFCYTIVVMTQNKIVDEQLVISKHQYAVDLLSVVIVSLAVFSIFILVLIRGVRKKILKLLDPGKSYGLPMLKSEWLGVILILCLAITYYTKRFQGFKLKRKLFKK